MSLSLSLLLSLSLHVVTLIVTLLLLSSSSSCNPWSCDICILTVTLPISFTICALPFSWHILFHTELHLRLLIIICLYSVPSLSDMILCPLVVNYLLLIPPSQTTPFYSVLQIWQKKWKMEVSLRWKWTVEGSGFSKSCVRRKQRDKDLDWINVKGAFCECSFPHWAVCQQGSWKQAKVETGKIQNKIQGGMGGSFDSVQVSTIYLVIRQGFTYRLLPRQVTEAWIPCCQWLGGDLLREDSRCKWESCNLENCFHLPQLRVETMIHGIPSWSVSSLSDEGTTVRTECPDIVSRKVGCPGCSSIW